MNMTIQKVSMRNFSLDLPLFVAAHWVCRILAVVAFVASVYTLFCLSATFVDNDFSVPRYGVEEDDDESRKLALGAQVAGWLGLGSQYSVRKVVEGDFVTLTKKYGDNIVSIVKKYRFGEANSNEEHSKLVLELMRRIPENRRSAYVSGWDTYLSEGLAALEARKEKDVNSPTLLTQQYDTHFHRALGVAMLVQAIRLGARVIFCVALLTNLLLFVLAMVMTVPILIGIERSGGRMCSGAKQANPALPPPASPVEPTLSAQPAAASATNCPKCAAPLAPGDTFCGECGNRLS
ncbi:MAG: zinc ribbon domain-containing protein [Zoogloeaceae bacterium]|jgi:hypothetical protein|nr:zinc ribbon domain-containing protein [Zoogloeaceae bacterium]